MIDSFELVCILVYFEENLGIALFIKCKKAIKSSLNHIILFSLRMYYTFYNQWETISATYQKCVETGFWEFTSKCKASRDHLVIYPQTTVRKTWKPEIGEKCWKWTFSFSFFPFFFINGSVRVISAPWMAGREDESWLFITTSIFISVDPV